MSEDTTTSEQLAEIERQATQYTPPEGWRLVETHEELDIPGRDQYVRGPNRYIRPIDPQPQPQQASDSETETIEDLRRQLAACEMLLAEAGWSGEQVNAELQQLREQLQTLTRERDRYRNQLAGAIEHSKAPEAQALPTKTQELETKTQELPEYTSPEGWRVLAVGEILQAGDMWVWPTDDGRRYPTHRIGDAVGPNRQYIRRIKPQPQPEPQPQPQPADTADELRSEIHYLQRELGEAIQGRDLFAAANREQADKIGALQGEARDLNMEIGGLQRQLAVAKEELTIAAAVSQQLQIELDAAQQVPADLPELRQLRLRLADMTLDRDTYKDAYDRIFADLCTIKETTKAETVEAIVEWLEPVRLVDNQSLANETMQHLPQIMRHLTGLDSHAID